MNKKAPPKKYRKIKHKADIGIRFYGNSLEESFENASAGMFSSISDLRNIHPASSRQIIIDYGG